jgi:hypothetical protein
MLPLQAAERHGPLVRLSRWNTARIIPFMNPTLRLLATSALLASLASCVVYDPYYPYGYAAPPNIPAAYNRSWSAAVGAMRDMGVSVTRADQGAGVIEGQRGGASVTTKITTQPDGRIRVETTTA